MNCTTHYDQKRAKLIKMVHIAANELRLLDPKRHESDLDDEYHLLLRQWNRPGTRQPVTSSTQMSTEQLSELYRHLKRLGFKVRPKDSSAASAPPREKDSSWKKYPSSIDGLRQELCDLAKERWGLEWERPLNSLCIHFGVRHWKWLDVAHAK